MLIIIAELAFIIWLSKKLSNDNSKIKAITLFAIFEQTIILLVYRINLNTINRVVYYSDAEVYWDNTLTLLNGGHLIGSQTGYAYYCMLLQLVSPFVSVIWNNISNICLLDCSVLLLAHVMVLGSVSQKNILLFLRFNLYNPLIIYGLGRNLKDSLFLFIIVVVVYLYCLFKQNKQYLYIIPIIALTIFVSTVRPWGFLIMPILAIDSLITTKGDNKKHNLLLSCLIIILFLVVLRFTSLWNHVLLWEPIVMDNAGNLSVSEMIAAPLKILTGPGPLRSIFGKEYFQFYTVSGNVFCFFGAFMWWIALSIFIDNYNKLTITGNNYVIILLCLLFILIYSMQYGGSLELRFRGVIYVLFSSAYISLLASNYRITYRSIISFVVISFVGTIFSF